MSLSWRFPSVAFPSLVTCAAVYPQLPTNVACDPNEMAKSLKRQMNRQFKTKHSVIFIQKRGLECSLQCSPHCLHALPPRSSPRHVWTHFLKGPRQCSEWVPAGMWPRFSIRSPAPEHRAISQVPQAHSMNRAPGGWVRVRNRIHVQTTDMYRAAPEPQMMLSGRMAARLWEGRGISPGHYISPGSQLETAVLYSFCQATCTPP